jgi:DNA-binding HxlR family transcriptional regulator
MKRTSFAGATCPVAAALEAVGEWWSLLVVREAFQGARRFDQLQERLGIARNVLTSRLRALVEHGVLERRRYQAHPPRFEYALTEKGRALYPVLVTLFTWGRRWEPGLRAASLVDAATGRTVEPVLVDRLTGMAVEPGKVRMARGEPGTVPPVNAPAPRRTGARRRLGQGG